MLLSRRHFFFGSLAAPAFAAKKQTGEKPNIVLITVDNLPSWMLGCCGNKEVRTPHIDQVAETGLRFSNHFVAAPVPALSRAVLLTGRSPMQLGDVGAAIPASEITLAKTLEAAGYTPQAVAATAYDPNPGQGGMAAGILEKLAGKPPFYIELQLQQLFQIYLWVERRLG